MADSDPPFPDADSRHVLEPGCARCPALVEARECISWGTGDRDADVMVVGEAPGAGDPDADRWRGGNWTGLAFTARHSGRIVRSTLADLGYAPGNCYVTNAVKCYPADGEGSNRAPTDAERRACGAHLATELDAVDPTAVVAAGKHATRSLLDLAGRDPPDGFVESILDPVPCPAFGAWLVPVLHPAYRSLWLARLDYDPDAYVADLGDTLSRLLDVGPPS